MAYVQRGTEFRVNSQTGADQNKPDITLLTNGGFVITWTDESGTLGDSAGSGIKAQLYNSSGAAVGGEFLVNTQTTGNQHFSRVTALNDGGFVVAWTDASGVSDGSFSSIQAQLFDAAGGKVGSEFRVNTQSFSSQALPTIARLTNGGFIIAWEDLAGDTSGGGIKAQLYGSSGAAVGGEFLVNTQTAGAQRATQVSGLTNGGFVITWEDSSATPGDSSQSTIKAQIFAPNGAKIGTEFFANATTAMASADVAALTGGGFVISWRDDSTSGDIKAQIFNASGAKVGLQFLVNAQTNGIQADPSITALTDGGFVVTWTDFANIVDASIKAQAFDATGAKVGGEFLVNTQNSAHQNDPAIAALPDDGFAVVWADQSGTLGDSAGWSIKAQTYQSVATSGDDTFTAPLGNKHFDGLGGTDTVNFSFRLVDATITYSGNQVIVDSASSHTVLTGFETFVFADGTVNNADGDVLVDDLFYYSKYHDVWNAHVDADAHYHGVGWHEGRDPSAFFSTSFYRALNPDVKAAGIDPLVHFHQAGWQDGRTPSLTFSLAKYLATNPDVAAAHIDPLWHFLAVGASEGRQPFAPTALLKANGFDAVYYLVNNPDVAAAGVDPFFHFQNIGWKEGRDPNALFDTSGYLSTYTDVAAAHINPFDHYSSVGWKEGRDPSVGFDTTSYLAAYPDVAAAHVNPLAHFLAFGQHEGRSAFADGVWG